MATTMRKEIPDAKVEINNNNRAAIRNKLIDLSDKLRKGDISADDFLKEIKDAFYVNLEEKESGYATQKLKGNTHVLRISNQHSKARNFAKNKQFKNNTSVVIKLAGGLFRPDGRVTLEELIYDPDNLTVDKKLGIVKGLQDWLSTGEYTDKGYDDRYVSPRSADRSNGSDKSNTTDGKDTMQADKGSTTEYLKTSKGEVYGFVKDGKIYIDPSLMNPNTPLHEYTHLFDKAVQKKNPKLWARGKEVMKELPLWKEVENDPAYSDIKDDEDRDRPDRSDRSNGSNTAVAEGGKVGERETKTATSEGSGAVSGTASSDSLNPSGEVHLSHSYSTQTDLVAKLRQNFKEIAQKVKKFINGGYSLKKGCKLRLQPFFVVSFAYIKQNAYLYGGKQKQRGGRHDNINSTVYNLHVGFHSSSAREI